MAAGSAAAPDGTSASTAPLAAEPQAADASAAPAPDTTPDTPSGTARAAAAPAGARAELGPADCARLLAEHFPALFGPGVVKPVKLRIQADIQQRAPGVFTKKALSLFLHRHTTGSAYLRALLASPTRFDLDGQPAGEIAPEHREAARVEVERRRAIVEAKKEAGRAAARAAREAARPPRPPRPHQATAPADAEGAEAAARPPRGDRPAHGSRPAGGAGGGRPPRAEGDRRPKRPGDAPRPPHGGRADRPPRPDRPRDPRPQDDRPPRADAAPAEPLTPEQAAEAEARRQRAQLLRAFEQSPLSKANFGALKGLSEAALDALLAQARADRERR